MRFIALLTLLFSFSSIQAASIFQITPTYPDGTSQAVQDALNLVYGDIEDQVNGTLPDADAGTYLDGVANATAMAGQGQGADYSGNMTLFSLGFNFGIGITTAGIGGIADAFSGAASLPGFGASTTATAGLSLRALKLPKIGFFDLAKLNIFANYFSLTLPATIEGVTGNISSLGVHVQYKLVDGSGVPGIMKWNGIDFTTGFNKTAFDFSITQSFSISEDTTVAGQPAEISFTNDVTLGADVSIMSIPIEISTSAQTLYFVSPFVGLGVDFNFGSANSSIDGEGPITINGAGVPAGVSAESTLNIGSEGGPSFTNARLFYGAQINMAFFKIYTQVNHGLGNDAMAVNVGAKIAW